MKNIPISLEVEGQVFTSLDASTEPLAEKSFFQCHFEHCTFTETSWKNTQFSECTFKNCTLNKVDMENYQFHNVSFIECTFIGIAFFRCNTTFLFSISIEKCLLKYCNFSNMPLKRTSFKGSTLHSCTFLGNDLSETNFTLTDLRETTFHSCDLSHANFCDAKHYSIDPQLNKIKKAQFSFPEVIGLLCGFDITIK